MKEKFGLLTPKNEVGKNKRGEKIWEFSCDCGNEYTGVLTVIRRQSKIVENPRVPSCGCENTRVRVSANTTHGRAHHPLYTVYKGMRSRCYNPNNTRYSRYGGRGVTVCSEWLEDRNKFFIWAIANGWAKGLQLDKDILCDEQGISPKVYSPNTCQFISKKENTRHSANRSNAANSRVKIDKKTALEIQRIYSEGMVTQRELAQRYSVSQNTICRVINN